MEFLILHKICLGGQTQNSLADVHGYKSRIGGSGKSQIFWVYGGVRAYHTTAITLSLDSDYHKFQYFA